MGNSSTTEEHKTAQTTNNNTVNNNTSTTVNKANCGNNSHNTTTNVDNSKTVNNNCYVFGEFGNQENNSGMVTFALQLAKQAVEESKGKDEKAIKDINKKYLREAYHKAKVYEINKSQMDKMFLVMNDKEKWGLEKNEFYQVRNELREEEYQTRQREKQRIEQLEQRVAQLEKEKSAPANQPAAPTENKLELTSAPELNPSVKDYTIAIQYSCTAPMDLVAELFKREGETLPSFGKEVKKNLQPSAGTADSIPLKITGGEIKPGEYVLKCWGVQAGTADQQDSWKNAIMLQEKSLVVA